MHVRWVKNGQEVCHASSYGAFFQPSVLSFSCAEQLQTAAEESEEPAAAEAGGDKTAAGGKDGKEPRARAERNGSRDRTAERPSRASAGRDDERERGGRRGSGGGTERERPDEDQSKKDRKRARRDSMEGAGATAPAAVELEPGERLAPRNLANMEGGGARLVSCSSHILYEILSVCV